MKESPANSNKVKYNSWYYNQEVSGPAYPWCMVFVQWCFAQAGGAGLLPEKTASCGALMRAAQAAGLWVTKDFRPGDVVIYDFPGGGATDHCGIVDGLTPTGVTAIEGNTSESGSQSNGGMVCRKMRHDRPRPQGGCGVGLGAWYSGRQCPGGSDAIPALDPAAVLYHDVQVCQVLGQSLLIHLPYNNKFTYPPAPDFRCWGVFSFSACGGHRGVLAFSFAGMGIIYTPEGLTGCCNSRIGAGEGYSCCASIIYRQTRGQNRTPGKSNPGPHHRSYSGQTRYQRTWPVPYIRPG